MATAHRRGVTRRTVGLPFDVGEPADSAARGRVSRCSGRRVRVGDLGSCRWCVLTTKARLSRRRRGGRFRPRRLRLDDRSDHTLLLRPMRPALPMPRARSCQQRATPGPGALCHTWEGRHRTPPVGPTGRALPRTHRRAPGNPAAGLPASVRRAYRDEGRVFAQEHGLTAAEVVRATTAGPGAVRRPGWRRARRVARAGPPPCSCAGPPASHRMRSRPTALRRPAPGGLRWAAWAPGRACEALCAWAVPDRLANGRHITSNSFPSGSCMAAA
ncbi:hypothetical protein HMPREF1486_06481 [Streptomyces sp. HPH0547]|nr:hypothetical protein HMPREF1486_06481 [Streptomyces sp. HPH0547]